MWQERNRELLWDSGGKVGLLQVALVLGNCGPELLPEGGSLCGTGGLGISGGFIISKPCCVWLWRGAVRRGSVCGLYQVLVSWLWKGVSKERFQRLSEAGICILSYITMYYHIL